MMTENKKLALIEGYVLDTLSEQDLQLMNQLREATTNPPIEEEIAFYEDLRDGAILFGDARFKLELQEMERHWQLKQRATLQETLQKKWHSLADKTENFLNELTQFFAPVPNYEAALLQATRSTAAQWQVPPNGIDAQAELHFSFSKPLDKNHTFTVENNQLKVITQQILAKGCRHFTLEVKGYLPGRYYWKLIGERETIIGMFFVGRT